MGLGPKAILMALLIAGAGFAATAEVSAESRQCRTLKAQLAKLGRTPTRTTSKKYKKYDSYARKQQAALNRAKADARRRGCSGGFSLFKRKRHASCDGLEKKIGRMKRNLAKLQGKRNRYAGTSGKSAQSRRSIQAKMARLNCGKKSHQVAVVRKKRRPTVAPDRSQQRSSAATRQVKRAATRQVKQAATQRVKRASTKGSGGLFALLRGSSKVQSAKRDTKRRRIKRYALKMPHETNTPKRTEKYRRFSGGGSYRTLCVRSCDGFYFPISFDATQSDLERDEMICQSLCPSAGAELYFHRSSDPDSKNMMSLAGELYSEHPAAYRYRTNYDENCSCKRSGTTFEVVGLYEDETDRPKRAEPVALRGIGKSIALPVPRFPLGEDPETVANMKGDFDPFDDEVAVLVKKDKPTKRKIRQVGPAYLYKRGALAQSAPRDEAEKSTE